MQTLDVGETATIATAWYDAAKQAAEPSAITLTIHPPSGADIVKVKADMTGSESVAGSGTDDVWSYGQIVTLEGLWRYDVEGVVDSADVELPSGLFLVGASSRPTGPCEPWCTWAEVLACAPASLAEATTAQAESAIDVASEILWNLSDRVYSGICQTTRSLCLSCRECWPSICRCEPHNGFNLGRRSPVWAAWDVVVNGETIDASEYRIVDRRWLARNDGHAWPMGWDVLDPTAFVASWAYGRQVPVGGRRAAALYAAHIARRCMDLGCSDAKSQVTSINAEGVTYVIDPAMLDSGRTGYEQVDAWIISDRIGRRPRPRLFAPGAPSQRAFR